MLFSTGHYFKKILIEAKYSINSFLGVCPLLTMFFIFCKEKKKYTFVRLDNVIHIGYDARFGFDTEVLQKSC
jgi:hypothetical protein